MTDTKYKLDWVNEAAFESALVIEDVASGERIAELDVAHGPAVQPDGGKSPSLDITETACTTVLGGHHWSHPNYADMSRHRICVLCGKHQVQNRDWADV